jgi:hypothetical protein
MKPLNVQSSPASSHSKIHRRTIFPNSILSECSASQIFTAVVIINGRKLKYTKLKWPLGALFSYSI